MKSLLLWLRLAGTCVICMSPKTRKRERKKIKPSFRVLFLRIRAFYFRLSSFVTLSFFSTSSSSSSSHFPLDVANFAGGKERKRRRGGGMLEKRKYSSFSLHTLTFNTNCTDTCQVYFSYS